LISGTREPVGDRWSLSKKNVRETGKLSKRSGMRGKKGKRQRQGGVEREERGGIGEERGAGGLRKEAQQENIQRRKKSLKP